MSVDSYKKFIIIGALALCAGYFLPWILDSGSGQSISGFDMLKAGWEYLQSLLAQEPFNWQMVDWNVAIFYAAVTLPALGALLSLLYCLFNPAGGNGGIGSFYFLLPFLTLAGIWAFIMITYGKQSAGGLIATAIADTVKNDALDLSKTAGLWLVHVGTVLMLLARLARGGQRKL